MKIIEKVLTFGNNVALLLWKLRVKWAMNQQRRRTQREQAWSMKVALQRVRWANALETARKFDAESDR